MVEKGKTADRRSFLRDGARIVGAIAFAGSAGFAAVRRGRGDDLVWQLDPDKCMACGNCATHCVLDMSAVKCVNCFDMCGYCDICTGYFEAGYSVTDTAAENQMCPTGAVVRKFIEQKASQRFYEYTIDRPLCIGCGKCVKGCALMNGSMCLQVEHDRCLNCNECTIATACPTQAFYRIPAEQKEILKRAGARALKSRGHKMLREAGDDEAKQQEANELMARAETQFRWRAEQERREGERARGQV
jgi:electron transport complex protein RnfB